MARLWTAHERQGAKGGVRLREVELGGKVAFADFGGEGRPLVLVHGLGASHANWLAAAPHLTRLGRVVAVDLVGYGHTPAAGRAQGVAGQRRMLHRFLTEVVGEPAVLVGHSMGGLVALAQAALAPQSVAALALVAPAQPPSLAAPPSLALLARFLLHALPGVGELALWWDGWRGGARRLVMDLLTLGCADVRRVPAPVLEANVALVQTRMQRMPFGHTASYLASTRSLLFTLARRKQVRRWVEAVRAPTLLVHGREDRLVPFASSEALARARPDWRFAPLGGTGHAVMLEDAARFCQLLTGWLEGLGSESRPSHCPSAIPARTERPASLALLPA